MRSHTIKNKWTFEVWKDSNNKGINTFQNNLLEPVLFERLDSIRLSQSKY